MKDKTYEELLNENHVLKQVLALTPGHVYWKNIDGERLGCNNGLLNYLNLSSVEEYTDKTNSDLNLSQDAVNRFTKIDKQVLESEETVISEESDTRNDNEFVFISSKSPFYDVDGKLIGIIGTSIDISDRKRAEKLERELEIQRQVSEKTKLWAGAIAHEVRTPLSALGMRLSLIDSVLNNIDDDTNPKDLLKAVKRLKDVPEKINQSLRQAHHVVNMTLMKARSGDLGGIALTPISVEKLVRTALDEYPFQDENEKGLVKVNIVEDFKILSEQNYFNHLIFNLVKNAIYFIKKAHQGEITIKAEVTDSENILTFTDTAMGVDSETLKQFFKPFFTKRQHGTGVGLNLCKNLVETFGGKIEAKSELGQYMTFEMKFPRG